MTIFGNDCPAGMVQVEFVSCPPSARQGDSGWTPVTHATIDVYVDGKRYHLVIGDYHDGTAARRGLHIVTDQPIRSAQTALNAVSLFPAPPTPEEP